MDSLSEPLTCYNKGCGKKFRFDENSENACVHHPGGPIFHDGRQGWSCCKKRVSDFTEFLNIKGCTTGYHSNVKPAVPEKAEKTPVQSKEPMYQLEVKPQHRPPNPVLAERPSEDEPLVELTKTVGASLKTQLENLNLNDSSDAALKDDGTIKIGTCCNNKGCKASYEGEHSNTEDCIYHSGVPVFHEGMKYWTCCQRKTTDFDVFLNQEGCETGRHNWHKPKVTEEKQVRVDWHQTTSIVCISIFAKVAIPDKTIVKANRVKCQVTLVYEGGNSIYQKDFILREAIDPLKSSVKLLGTKVELDLKKAEAFSWPTLEVPATSS
ncbi:cysteine and histidine-rich domain-containing protein 1-like [Physella acuta]|uniref:cysteine and histidine-rich domain-containing protein 1-like n=1 Tax=Physella acuta TaxID=109671 RepID=UPI0027DBC1D3|nr:cysteine and histidine-rich domain-containing protein 1-like [Physella acuta]